MAGQLIPQWMRRSYCWKMQELPKNSKEFFKFQNWDYWPREIYFGDKNKWVGTLKEIKEYSSFT